MSSLEKTSMRTEIHYEVRKTTYFNKQFNKIIPKNKKEDVLSRIEKLSNNPNTGKPLGNNLYELKLDKFRIYYTKYESELIIVAITVSDKKHQQETIEFVKKCVDSAQLLDKSITFK